MELIKGMLISPEQNGGKNIMSTGKPKFKSPFSLNLSLLNSANNQDNREDLPALDNPNN